MLREQAFTELCKLCKAPAAGVCPRCGIVVCQPHRTEPHGCCQDCAADMFTAVAKAGKTAMTAGSAVSLGALAIIYLLSRLHVLPVAVTGAALVALLAGVSMIAYGGLVAPRTAEAKLVGRLHHRELPPATGTDEPR